MKKLFIALAVVSSFAILAPPAEAAHGRERHPGHQGRPGRSVVVVHPGYPIHRAFPQVIVHGPRYAPRVIGSVFLPPLMFRSVVVVRPHRDALCWEDSDWISRDDDWTDVTLNADARGSGLFLEVASGRVQLEFAEVVFDNGEVQVVDFDRSTLRAGTYPVLRLHDGRRVDHVRLVARSRSDRAKVMLMMEK